MAKPPPHNELPAPPPALPGTTHEYYPPYSDEGGRLRCEVCYHGFEAEKVAWTLSSAEFSGEKQTLKFCLACPPCRAYDQLVIICTCGVWHTRGSLEDPEKPEEPEEPGSDTQASVQEVRCFCGRNLIVRRP